MLLNPLRQAQLLIRGASYSALPDFLSMRRSDLVYELCHSKALIKDTVRRKVDGAEPWVSDFMKSSRIMESYIILQSQKTAKTTMLMFENVDPDVVGGQTKMTNEKEEHYFLVQELIFLRQFSSMLRRAGYEEVPKTIIQARLNYRHRYEKIMMKVPHQYYKYLRIWVKGQRKHSKSPYSHFHDKNFNDRSWEGLSMPWYQRTQVGLTVLFATIFSYFNDVLDVIIDFEIRSLALISFVWAYRDFFHLYKSEQQDYILTWKRMLYYKNTANNNGLVVKIVHDAYERQLKEALLVYGTALKLAAAGAVITETEVIRSACKFLSDLHETKVEEKHINFPSAFRLLRCLGVLDRQEQAENELEVIPPEDAVIRLNKSLIKLAM